MMLLVLGNGQAMVDQNRDQFLQAFTAYCDSPPALVHKLARHASTERNNKTIEALLIFIDECRDRVLFALQRLDRASENRANRIREYNERHKTTADET